MKKHLPTARGAAIAELALRLSAAAHRRGILAEPRAPRGALKAIPRLRPR